MEEKNANVICIESDTDSDRTVIIEPSPKPPSKPPERRAKKRRSSHHSRGPDHKRSHVDDKKRTHRSRPRRHRRSSEKVDLTARMLQLFGHSPVRSRDASLKDTLDVNLTQKAKHQEAIAESTLVVPLVKSVLDAPNENTNSIAKYSSKRSSVDTENKLARISPVVKDFNKEVISSISLKMCKVELDAIDSDSTNYASCNTQVKEENNISCIETYTDNVIEEMPTGYSQDAINKAKALEKYSETLSKEFDKNINFKTEVIDSAYCLQDIDETLVQCDGKNKNTELVNGDLNGSKSSDSTAMENLDTSRLNNPSSGTRNNVETIVTCSMNSFLVKREFINRTNNDLSESSMTINTDADENNTLKNLSASKTVNENVQLNKVDHSELKNISTIAPEIIKAVKTEVVEVSQTENVQKEDRSENTCSMNSVSVKNEFTNLSNNDLSELSMPINTAADGIDTQKYFSASKTVNENMQLNKVDHSELKNISITAPEIIKAVKTEVVEVNQTENVQKEDRSENICSMNSVSVKNEFTNLSNNDLSELSMPINTAADGTDTQKYLSASKASNENMQLNKINQSAINNITITAPEISNMKKVVEYDNTETVEVNQIKNDQKEQVRPENINPMSINENIDVEMLMPNGIKVCLPRVNMNEVNQQSKPSNNEQLISLQSHPPADHCCILKNYDIGKEHQFTQNNYEFKTKNQQTNSLDSTAQSGKSHKSLDLPDSDKTDDEHSQVPRLKLVSINELLTKPNELPLSNTFSNNSSHSTSNLPSTSCTLENPRMSLQHEKSSTSNLLNSNQYHPNLNQQDINQINSISNRTPDECQVQNYNSHQDANKIIPVSNKTCDQSAPQHFISHQGTNQINLVPYNRTLEQSLQQNFISHQDTNQINSISNQTQLQNYASHQDPGQINAVSYRTPEQLQQQNYVSHQDPGQINAVSYRTPEQLQQQNYVSYQDPGQINAVSYRTPGQLQQQNYVSHQGANQINSVLSRLLQSKQQYHPNHEVQRISKDATVNTSVRIADSTTTNTEKPKLNATKSIKSTNPVSSQKTSALQKTKPVVQLINNQALSSVLNIVCVAYLDYKYYQTRSRMMESFYLIDTVELDKHYEKCMVKNYNIFFRHWKSCNPQPNLDYLVMKVEPLLKKKVQKYYSVSASQIKQVIKKMCDINNNFFFNFLQNLQLCNRSTSRTNVPVSWETNDLNISNSSTFPKPYEGHLLPNTNVENSIPSPQRGFGEYPVHQNNNNYNQNGLRYELQKTHSAKDSRGYSTINNAQQININNAQQINNAYPSHNFHPGMQLNKTNPIVTATPSNLGVNTSVVPYNAQIVVYNQQPRISNEIVENRRYAIENNFYATNVDTRNVQPNQIYPIAGLSSVNNTRGPANIQHLQQLSKAVEKQQYPVRNISNVNIADKAMINMSGVQSKQINPIIGAPQSNLNKNNSGVHQNEIYNTLQRQNYTNSGGYAKIHSYPGSNTDTLQMNQSVILPSQINGTVRDPPPAYPGVNAQVYQNTLYHQQQTKYQFLNNSKAPRMYEGIQSVQINPPLEAPHLYPSINKTVIPAGNNKLVNSVNTPQINTGLPQPNQINLTANNVEVPFNYQSELQRELQRGHTTKNNIVYENRNVSNVNNASARMHPKQINPILQSNSEYSVVTTQSQSCASHIPQNANNTSTYRTNEETAAYLSQTRSIRASQSTIQIINRQSEIPHRLPEYSLPAGNFINDYSLANTKQMVRPVNQQYEKINAPPQILAGKPVPHNRRNPNYADYALQQNINQTQPHITSTLNVIPVPVSPLFNHNNGVVVAADTSSSNIRNAFENSSQELPQQSNNRAIDELMRITLMEHGIEDNSLDSNVTHVNNIVAPDVFQRQSDSTEVTSSVVEEEHILYNDNSDIVVETDLQKKNGSDIFSQSVIEKEHILHNNNSNIVVESVLQKENGSNIVSQSVVEEEHILYNDNSDIVVETDLQKKNGSDIFSQSVIEKEHILHNNNSNIVVESVLQKENGSDIVSQSVIETKDNCEIVPESVLQIGNSKEFYAQKGQSNAVSEPTVQNEIILIKDDDTDIVDDLSICDDIVVDLKRDYRDNYNSDIDDSDIDDSDIDDSDIDDSDVDDIPLIIDMVKKEEEISEDEFENDLIKLPFT